jgi:hypothetical protein
VDLIYLYYRHGVSLLMAKAATSPRVRSVHEEMAAAYAARIGHSRPTAQRKNYWTTWEAYDGIIIENQAMGAAEMGNGFIKDDGQ